MIIIIAKLANKLPIIKNTGVSISDNKAKFSTLKFFYLTYSKKCFYHIYISKK